MILLGRMSRPQTELIIAAPRGHNRYQCGLYKTTVTPDHEGLRHRPEPFAWVTKAPSVSFALRSLALSCSGNVRRGDDDHRPIGVLDHAVRDAAKEH